MLDTRDLLEQFYQARKHQRATHLARRYMRNNYQDAEDAVQDAAVRALETKYPFEGRSQFSSWFSRVVLNEGFRHYRYRRVHAPEGESIEQIARMEDCEMINDLAHDPKPNPHDQATLKQRNEIILTAVSELGENERNAILLRYFLDLSNDEIARIEGLPVGTIKSRLTRARRRLEDRLSVFGVAA